MIRTPDNNSEPDLSSIGLNETPTQYSNFRLKRFRNMEGQVSFRDDFLSFKDEMKQLFISLQAETTKEIKTQFESWKSVSNARLIHIETSLSNIEKSYSEIEKTLEFTSAQYEDIKTKTNSLEQQCKDQRIHIMLLEDKLEEMQRISKMNYLEIRNVPKKDGETRKDVQNYLNSMCKSLNVNIGETIIKDFFRMPDKKGSNSVILLELNNNSNKNVILRAVKSFNKSNQVKLNSSHLGLPAPMVPVFVAEHLTPKARRLYYLARNMVKSKQILMSWISNAKVFTKKTEGSPPIHIQSEEQLERMASSSS